jgi:mono/diheme cytochrome c family protein
MNANFLITVALAVLLTGCNKQKSTEDFGISTAPKSDTENAEALALFKTKCYACHSVTTKTHDEIIAPPMIAAKKRYMMQFDNKEDFVKAVVAYALDPKAENALMKGAIDKFKPMPKQAFEEEDLKKIASYIYDNEIETPVWFEEHFKEEHKNGMGMGNGMGKGKGAAKAK